MKHLRLATLGALLLCAQAQGAERSTDTVMLQEKIMVQGTLCEAPESAIEAAKIAQSDGTEAQIEFLKSTCNDKQVAIIVPLKILLKTIRKDTSKTPIYAIEVDQYITGGGTIRRYMAVDLDIQDGSI
jgi:hypothetical protein